MPTESQANSQTAGPSPQPSTAPPVPDTVPAGTEDARFLAFAKENIGLLASVASVPMLSSAAGALKPPNNMDQLTVLSSLLCVIVFAACFTLRGILGAAPKSRRRWVKAIPGTLSLVIVGVAVYLIATFSALQYTSNAQQAAATLAAATSATATGAESESAVSSAPSRATGAAGATA